MDIYAKDEASLLSGAEALKASISYSAEKPEIKQLILEEIK